MASSLINSKGDLSERTVSVKTRDGNIIPINCVFQDIRPSSDIMGTVVAVHGAPGSHNDFKYMSPLFLEKNIRTVAINFPGLGFSSYDHRLNDDNDERVQIVQQIVEELELDKNVVFIGHSRGSENALKMAALNEERTVGVVLINPICLRPHRGIQPYWLLWTLAWIWKFVPFAQYILNPLISFVYKKLGLRAADELAAGVAFSLMRNAEFSDQQRYVDMLNSGNVKSLIFYAGRDPIVEKPVSRELATAFDGHCEIVCTDVSDEKAVELLEELLLNGSKSVSVCFETDGHFLQKTRAETIVNAVNIILSNK